MGCFGDMEATKKVDSTQNTASNSSMNYAPWYEAAGKDNYDLARSVLGQGFQRYDGELTAQLSNNEKMASDMIAKKAASGNAYQDTAAGDFKSYGSAPAKQYTFNTVADQNGALGTTQSYMNPFLEAVLAPALRQLGISGSQARQGINANATNAGAYGDARHGVVESEQRKNEAQQGTDIVGQAYSQAYQQAMQQREQDAGRQFSTQQAQEGADKAALERMRTSGIDLTNLDKYGVSRDLGLASALGQTGATERDVRQKTDDAKFSEFMREKGFTDQQAAFLASILNGTKTGTTTNGTQSSSGTQTTNQPNNTGWQAIGTLASALFL
jgi:hypothetical protein